MLTEAVRKRRRLFHGCTYEPWYKSYEAMLRRASGKHHSRCYDGITVCQEWLDPRNFKTWAESSGYAPGMSINRKNAKLGYSPDNCEWIPLSENVRLSHKSSPRSKDPASGRFTGGRNG